MARIYPNQLTKAFSAFNVPAEQAVYEKLSREVPDAYQVFHDFLWDDPSLDDSKTIGQIDFVIVRPDRGYVTLEVKGGRCNYNSDLRSWTTLDRDSQEHDITDPFDQARVASRVICKLLLNQPQLQNMFIPHYHAVIFPDSVFKKRSIRADIHDWQFLDQEAMFDLKRAIDMLFTYAFQGDGISLEQGNLIFNGIKHLHGDRSLDGIKPAATRIRQISEKLIRLTERQTDTLRLLREQKRLLIRGYAGSGKTTIAVHKAKMLAEQGKQVLLVCFNKPLSNYLKHECETFANITAGSFHDLCFGWMAEIGQDVKPDNSDKWWSETFPNLVADQIDRINHRFDAIIVDEGQDFKDAYWVLLEMMFVEPNKAVFYIFADASQNIYQGTGEYPITAPPICLDQNIRNTNEVFAVVKRACELPDDLRPSGISGPAVQLHTYANDRDMLSVLEKLLKRLITESVDPSDIVILGTKSKEHTVLKCDGKLGPFRLVEHRTSPWDLMTMTIHRFKGLESPVVILCELDEHVRHNWKELLYVGMTRTTGLLFILCQDAEAERLKSQLGL